MAYTWTFNLTQTSDIGAQLSKASWPQVAGQEININLQFPSSTVNQLVPVVFTIASLQGLMMVASQPMTIVTNDFTTPGNTVSLAANVPIFWGKDQGIPRRACRSGTAHARQASRGVDALPQHHMESPQWEA